MTRGTSFLPPSHLQSVQVDGRTLCYFSLYHILLSTTSSPHLDGLFPHGSRLWLIILHKTTCKAPGSVAFKSQTSHRRAIPPPSKSLLSLVKGVNMPERCGMDSFAFDAVVSTDIIMVVCISHIAYDNESMQMHGVGSFLPRLSSSTIALYVILSLCLSLFLLLCSLLVDMRQGLGVFCCCFFLLVFNYSLRVLTEKG